MLSIFEFKCIKNKGLCQLRGGVIIIKKAVQKLNIFVLLVKEKAL